MQSAIRHVKRRNAIHKLKLSGNGFLGNGSCEKEGSRNRRCGYKAQYDPLKIRRGKAVRDNPDPAVTEVVRWADDSLCKWCGGTCHGIQTEQ
jgi:hypothetical protein